MSGRMFGAGRSAGPLKRRGLLAGAAALTAGLMAKLGTAERAEATHGGSGEYIHVGFNQTFSGLETGVTNSSNDRPALAGTNGLVPGEPSSTILAAPDGVQGITNKEAGGGVRGVGILLGVIGQVRRGGAPTSHNAIGVLGQTQFGAAVRGEIFGGGNGTGVVSVASGCEFGNANNVGVGGSGRGIGGALGNKTGVLGITDGSLGVGVQGWAIGAGTGIRGSSNGGGGPDFAGFGTGVDWRSGSGYGVYAVSQSGPGVFGGSNSNIGVYANSNLTTGVYATAPQKAVWGRTQSATGIGVFGQATQANQGAYGIYGAAPPPAWAGYFEGNVYVTGQVIQAGNAPAASAVQSPDGAVRTLYCVDSAEPVVEDTGEGKLTGGRAEIKLDSDFVAVAEGGAYQVFLTPYADCKGLAVTVRGPGGFTVAELQGGTSDAGFGYRVVAKRKATPVRRLERLAAPRRLDAKELEPPTLPKPPETPPASPEIPATGAFDPPKPGPTDLPTPGPGLPQRGGPPSAR